MRYGGYLQNLTFPGKAANANMTTVVQAQRLEKTYRAGDVDVLAVRGVDFAIDAGAFVAFVGPSGSGKTTLLNMIGCLDNPSAGTLTRARYRHRHARSVAPPPTFAAPTSASSSRTST